VLVDRKHIVTCAHVVKAALGEPGIPVGSVVCLDFPFIGEGCRARVLEEGWRDITGDQSGDIAVLELETPLPARAAPPPLLCPPRLEGREVLTYRRRGWNEMAGFSCSHS
jgi:cellulose synthase operon protein C